jgi:AcrR family transcriptional regulator
VSTSARLIDDGGTSDRARFSRRQEEIVDAIEAIVVREGLRGIRMGDLATEVGCSRSTLYEIAPSKEDLLLLVVDRMMRRISERGAAAIAAADTHVDRMRAMLHVGAVDFAELGPRFLDAVADHPPARMLFDRWIAVCRDALERMIEDAAAAGEIRPVNAPIVAEMMFAGALRFTDPTVTRDFGVDSANAYSQMVDVLLNGLRPR